MALAVVGGVIAGKPGNGGESWVRASWLLGLRRLGFDVHLVEVLDRDLLTGEEPGRELERSAAGAQLTAAVEELSLHGQVSVLDEHGRSLYGRPARELEEMIGEADVVFDLSGHLGCTTLSTAPRLRVYVDLDPGFTQAWHADPALAFTVSGYDRYVTVGANVGTPSCSIPSGGVRWLGTLPPVLLELWASEPLVSDPYRFTTVATWRSPFGRIVLGERELGLKHHEFRRLIDLPEKVGDAQFELALDIEPARRRRISRSCAPTGGRVVASREVASTPRAFGDYVRGSGAELSVAQPAYVETAQRLVQRPHRRLPGERPARARPGDGRRAQVRRSARASSPSLAA